MIQAFRIDRRWAVALLLAALPACSSEDSAGRVPRLVLVYAPCSVNRDYLAPYDPDVTFTPRIAEFAKDARVFTRHHTEAGLSGISFASLLSGTQALGHQVYTHPRKLPQDLHLMAEAFAANGYETFFYDGHQMASLRLGYGQGVPRENVVLPQRMQASKTANEERFVKILERLRDDPEYRAYVQVVFTVTHHPYQNNFEREYLLKFMDRHPELVGELTIEDIDRYLAFYVKERFGLQWNFPETIKRVGLSPAEVERLAQVLELCYRVSVSQLDDYFGGVLQKIRDAGMDDDSLIAFTTDHGETLYRENALFHWTHGWQLAPEVLNIGLIVRSPAAGVTPGTYDAVTRSVDVFPTLAGLCRIPVPENQEVIGVDLSPALQGQVPLPELRAFGHTAVLSEAYFRRTRDMTLRNSLVAHSSAEPIWTFVREGDLVCKLRKYEGGSWGYQVFNWTEDPREERDLYDPDDPHHQELAAAAKMYKSQLVAGYEHVGTANDLSEEESLKRLRALGYVQ